MSFRDGEDLIAKRVIFVTYEIIMEGCWNFVPEFAQNLKRQQGRLCDVWHLDEIFVKIKGERYYLLGLAVVLSRVMEQFVFEVSSTDPTVLAGAAALATTVALLASLLPALRASRSDPMEALAAE